MTEHEQKQLFAKLLLKMGEPYRAALEIFPEDAGRAVEVAHKWPKDPLVISIKNGICDEIDEMELLPTKAEACTDLLAQAKSMRGTDQYSKIMKLYLDARGFVTKPTNAIQITDNSITAKFDIENINNVTEAERVYKELIG